MKAELYRNQLMDMLHEMFPDGLPEDFDGLELSFKTKRFKLEVDVADYEKHKPKQAKSFSQRLTRQDKHLLDLMKITQ